MYNIDLYTYWKKPYILRKKFSIRPLDEEGKETYYSDRSHVKHYLKRTDPFVFKSIVGVDYNTLVKQQKDDIEILKNLKEKGFNQKDNSKKDNDNIQDNTNMEKEENNTNYIPEQNNINTINNPNIHNENINNSINKNIFKPYNNQASNLATFRPYNKKKDFKDIYGYENITSFKSNGEKYLYMINKMKKNNFNENDYLKPKRKYDGFTVNEAPTIEKNRPNTASFDYFNNRINQTLN